MKYFVTGSSGYLGERLCNAILDQGHEVIFGVRTLPDSIKPFLIYNIEDGDNFNLPKVDIIFHLACSRKIIDNGDDDFKAAKNLIHAAKKIDAKFIFVSSQTAQEFAPTGYGRVKWRIEQEVAKYGFISIRAGQIYGGSEKALFGTLISFLKKSPVIPAFIPAPQIQPIHIDDFVTALIEASNLNLADLPLLSIAQPDSISFTFFLQEIGRKRLNKLVVPIPIPVWMVKIFGNIIGSRLKSALGFDRMISLFSLPKLDVELSLKILKIKLRKFPQGLQMKKKTSRSILIREGKSFCFYVLNSKPPLVLIKRYVKSCEALFPFDHFQLPWWALHFPKLLALIDKTPLKNENFYKIFQAKLNFSVSISEASIAGSIKFMDKQDDHYAISRFFKLLKILIQELIWRTLSFISKPYLNHITKNN